MEFTKLHALGNDFIIVDVRERKSERSLSKVALALCDRHRGVGADGTLFYQPTAGDPDAEFSTLIYNSDGSRAEMSGNGVRCLAAHLVHSGEQTSNNPRIRTVSGVKKLILRRREGSRYDFECLMGRPVTKPALIPAGIEGGPGAILDYPLEVGAETVRVSVTSMGNPHCSTFWPDLAQAPMEYLGPRLEAHAAFPNRTNVEFVKVLDRHRLRVKFWERGVGPTLCSGTGASAAVVASILRGLVESPVDVETELGSLLVEWTPGKELSLTGPAEYICSGDFPGADIEP